MSKHTTPANTSTVSNLRATRVAVVQAAAFAVLRKQQEEARIVRRATAQHAKHQAYMIAVQQLAAEYGIDAAHTTLAVRPLRSAQQHAPSVQAGACKRVHALADLHIDRAATLAACKLEGINPATAATQYAVWNKGRKATMSH